MLSIVKCELKFKHVGHDLDDVFTKLFDPNDDEAIAEFYENHDVISEEYIDVPLPEEQLVFVNVYEVRREYGGAEEGGWWYNTYECIEVIPTKNKHSEVIRKHAIEANKEKAYGNIYSVLGGMEIEVLIETEPQRSETRERPYYE